jgi:hypothetical protein
MDDDHRSDDHRSGAETPAARARPRRWLLAVPLLLLAWPPLYDRTEPAILGIPFYYAYQLGVIPLAAGCTWLVLRSDRHR